MPPNVVCAEENAGGRVGEGGVGGSGCVGSVVEVVGSERYGVGAVEHVRLKRPWVDPPERIGIGMRAMFLELMFLMMLLPESVMLVLLDVDPFR